MTADGAPERKPTVHARDCNVVYVDARDERWEIRDYMRISGRIVRLRVQSDAAEYRLFAPAVGPCRLYAFAPFEPRDPEPELLRQQFGRALPTRSATTEALQDEPLLKFVDAVEEDPPHVRALGGG